MLRRVAIVSWSCTLNRILHLTFLLAFGSMTTLARSDTAVTIEVETVGPMSPRNQAAWWSPIVHRDGDIYVSYLAANTPQDDVFVAKRSASGVWETRDTGVNAVYDVGHTQTSMAIDGKGFLHVFYGMHNNPIRIVASNQPECNENGFAAPAPAALTAFADGKYTYPNLTTAPNGDIFAIVRDQRASYANQQGRLFRFSNANRTWGELPPFAGQSGTTVYPDHIIADEAGDLHIVWEWAAGGAQGSRHYGSYARFDPDTNKYYRANGTEYPAGPITILNADIYQGLEGAETFQRDVHGVQSAKMTLDQQGRPIIAYGYSTTGTETGYQHRVARWTGTAWTHSTVTPGPFDIDKPWIAYSNGMLRYYGTLSASHPMHTGTDDIFLRTSADLGATWSDPVAVTNGLNVQRPAGITVGNIDYIYLPDIGAGTLYVATVTSPLPLTGDYNDDRAVDAADYVMWRKNLGTSIRLPNEDPDATPGEVTPEDYGVWLVHFAGLAATNSPGPLVSVPEPSSTLSFVGAAALIPWIGSRWQPSDSNVMKPAIRNP
jgi:hypothetical protein